MVKLYALSTCPWCKKTKKLLQENNITFEFLDVDLLTGIEQETALNEVRTLTGNDSFPVTLVGKKVFAGYKPDEILKALKDED